ncbi:glycosyltransferase family 39 protein [Nemorincola caseinilytica]|uniref:Glycosyltransferase family 39 protein n=1 Tax=Nemorincola caseinilytica TaxID=2054315 RepID=A0ABP8NKQ9_9BACT
MLFVVAVCVALCTYRQYGMSWDEQLQRAPGLLSYNYIFNGSNELFETESDNHGAAFELFLVIIEKSLGLTVPAEIYHMRHLVSHMVYLLGALAVALLALRTTASRALSCIAFLAMVFMPRIYAHSFFNSKDVPFLAFMAMSLLAAHVAFARQKGVYFVILGLVLGYATSIRIMGVSLFCIIFFFLLLDVWHARRERRIMLATLRNILLLSVFFCFAVYISWPYLWRSPVSTFVESFQLMTRYAWKSQVLFMGEYLDSEKLPWTYFPVWFGITTPLLWLVCGCAGMLLLIGSIARNPLRYLYNTPERGRLLLFGSFWGPVLSVIVLHSVIYDDWRHLYFVYPAFVLLGIHFLYTIYKGWYPRLIAVACVVQIGFVGWFTARNLNFSQVYFNPLVSHENEYLRNNYELDYWGAGIRKGMQYLADKKLDSVVAISSGGMTLLLENNILLLDPADAARLKIVYDRDSCNYFITNFRLHKEDYTKYPGVEYDIKVENSTVLRIYKVSDLRY